MASDKINVTGGTTGITHSEIKNIEPMVIGTGTTEVASITVVDAEEYLAKKVVKDGK